MKIKVCILLLCLAMLAMCVPAAAQYWCQAENILPDPDPGSTFDGADWDQLQKTAGVDSLVSRSNVDDTAALDGKGLKVIDNVATASSGLLYIKTQSAGSFGAAPNIATAVVRVKVSDGAAFNTPTPWPRNILLGLGGAGQKRGIGLGILPDSIVVSNATGNTLYPQNGAIQVLGINIIPCDNTVYATYTIVGRNPVSGNASFDIYRNGVKILSANDVNSTPEAPVGGIDCLAIGSTGGAAATGAWIFDAVGYRKGEYPAWDPLTPSSITGRVLDLTGTPVEGAKVEIGGLNFTTGPDGLFTIDSVVEGTWDLTVSKAGFYRKLKKNLVVGDQVTINLGDIPLAPIVAGAVAADTFSRIDSPGVPGSTEMVNGATAVYPWNGGFDIAGGWTAGGTNNGYMFQAGYTAPWGATGWGSSIGNGEFNHADFDATFTTLGLESGTAGNWGGFIYRSSLPYIYTDGGWNGSYMLHWRTDGSVALHKCNMTGYVVGGVNIADIPARANHDWTQPHNFRVLVSGPSHTVWLDGQKIIDVMDYDRLTGGYIGLVRAQINIKVDDVVVKQLTQVMGTITGKVMATGTTTGIVGARVKASLGTSDLGSGASTTTDANGNFTLTVPIANPVTVTAVGDGYYPGNAFNVEVNSGNNVDIYLNAPPTPDPLLDVVTDTFSRSPMVGLGFTEGTNSYPWVYGPHESSAYVAERLEFGGGVAASGVSVGGGFLPADVDMSVNVIMNTANWVGVIYRQSLPGTYDTYDGQTVANSGYLVFINSGDNKVYLWRNGVVASADTGISNWTVAHKLRVMAIGASHQVWIGNADGTNMVRMIDAIDTGKLTGGYTGLERDQATANFDDLVITRYTNDSGTISGIVTNAADGLPIADAEVTLSNGKLAKTDGSGNYMFNRLPDGTYTVTAIAEGYYYAQATTAVTGQGAATAPVLALQPLPATPDAVVIDTFSRDANSLDLGYTETTDGAIKVPWAKPAEADTTTEIVGVDFGTPMLKLNPCVTGFGPGLGHQFQPADIDMSVMLQFMADDGQQWAGLAYRQALIASHNQIDNARLSPKQTDADRGYLVYVRQDGSGIDLYRNGVIASAKISPGSRMDWGGMPRKLRVRAMGAHHEVFVGYDGMWEKVIDHYDFNGKTSGGFIGIMRANATVFADDFRVNAYRGPLSQITGTVTNDADQSLVTDAQIRFADGTIATTDASGVYTTSVGSASGKTSLQAVAPTYRQKTFTGIAVTPGSTTTFNIALAKLPDVNTLYYAQVPGPRYDTFSRPDAGGNTLDNLLGKTEDGMMSRGDATHPPVRGGLGGSYEGLSDAVRMRIQIRDQKFVLPDTTPAELGRGMGMAAVLGDSFPIDGDFTFVSEANPMTEPGDYIGACYRTWSAGAFMFHGYGVQLFADGKAQLVYSHGNQAGQHGANNPYQPVVVATYQFATPPDYTQPQNIRVRFEGPRHRAWVGDQLLWDVQDWGWMEYGYIGVIHRNAELRTDDWMVKFDSWLDYTEPVVSVTSVVDAKALETGTLVSLVGPVVTAQFDGFFYLEDPLRTAGIKVKSTTTVAIGTIPTVAGRTATADGEVFIDATNVTPGAAAPEAIKPLAMTNKANAPLVGLSNIGLLSTVWGKVVEVATDGTYCYVDDGSAVSYETGKTGIKVMINGTKKPAAGNYVSCTGIARKTSATVPVINMRSNADLVILQP